MTRNSPSDFDLVDELGVCRISQLQCCSAGLKDRDVPPCGSKCCPLLEPQYIAVKMKRPVVVFGRYDQPQLVNSVLLHRLIISFQFRFHAPCRVPPKKRMRRLRSLRVVATASVLICLLQIALRQEHSERTLVDAKLHLPRVITILYGDS